MSIVISYILHLRHDEKDDFLPVEKIILMTFGFQICHFFFLVSALPSLMGDILARRRSSSVLKLILAFLNSHC